MNFIFDSPNYHSIEEDNDNQPSIFPKFNSSFDFSDNEPSDTFFHPNTYNNDADNLFLNDQNYSSPNETDQILSQKNTSDKSTNNSNFISDDKEVNLDLNESNEKDNSSSINPKRYSFY